MQHTLAESGFTLDAEQIQDVLNSYNALSTFPDVQPTLDKLKSNPNLKAVVFSNGTHEMVSSSINNSPDLSPYASTFDDIIVVEECRKFKPDPHTYHHLARKVGKDIDDKQQMSEIWLVSGNPFVSLKGIGLR